MSRKIFPLFILSFLSALAFVLCGAGLLTAKPVMTTPFETAVLEAPIVCAAEVTGFQFDDLKTGEEVVEERWNAPLGKKFILFLDEDLCHFGWFASPKPDDEAIRKLLKDAGLN